MIEAVPHTNLLNVGKIQNNVWSREDYSRLKTAQNIKNSIRGSKLLQEIIEKLRIRSLFRDTEFRDYDEYDNPDDPNFSFQLNYGRAYSKHLQERFVKLSNLLKIRKQEGSRGLLSIRQRMVDWMLEVFTVFSTDYKDKGSNECTYFKAVEILDRGLDSKLINTENIHIYGIACMFLASSPLDRSPITLREAYKDIGHRAFPQEQIQMHIHRLAKDLGFKLTSPTLVDYLDKLVFDIFGDYRATVAAFNIRQVALFVLQCTLFDVKFQNHHPRVICTMALLHSIEVFFDEYDAQENLTTRQRLGSAGNRENLYCAVLSESKVEKSQLNALLRELDEYLQLIRRHIESGEFKHLGSHFSYNFETREDA